MLVLKFFILTVSVGLAAAIDDRSSAKVAASSSDEYVVDKSSKNSEKASGSNRYETDVDPTSGLDENGENYIPFQWGVEIIKREYDDYVLPDGTVYRVPSGALPPYRHRGPPSTYNVPYWVFKTGKGHSDVTYGKPKLVETYDRQLLELLMQSWYSNDYWDRYYPPNYSASESSYYDDNGGGDGADYHRSSSAPVAEKTSRPAAKEKTTTRGQRNDDEVPLVYYMNSYHNNKRWK